MNLGARAVSPQRIKLCLCDWNVQPLADVLEDHPELWNTTPDRTTPTDSPHRELSDIYIRYSVKPRDTEEHESIWYPAAKVLKPVHDLIFDLMHWYSAERLGGVLITKIPAGKMCYPHRDASWHTDYYAKFGLCVAAAPGQLFCFDDEALETQTGDLFWFDNHYTHWVTNPTDEDRITLIVLMRRT